MIIRERLQSSTPVFGLTALLFVLASNGLSQSPMGAIQHPPVENSVWRATFMGIEEIPDLAETKLVFSVADKRTEEVRELSYQGILESVSDVVLIGRKLVTTGTIGRSAASFVAIIDLESGRQDTIWTYKYQFSPSRRFLVFSTFYARGIQPEAMRSIVLVYDMAKGVAENRLPSFREEHHQRYSGKPVFPEKNVTQRSYDRMLGENQSAMSPFLWSADEKTLVFVAFKNAKWRNSLVQIDLTDGLDAPKIRSKDIDIREYIKWDKIHQSTVEELEANPRGLIVKDIAWDESGRVVLRPYRQYWLPKKITLTLPSSAP